MRLWIGIRVILLMSKLYKKIFFIIGGENKKYLILLIALTILGTFLELIGIALIIPVMKVILDPNVFLTYPLLVDYFDEINSYSHGQIIFFSIMILLSIYVFKSMYLGVLIWKQIGFVFDIQEQTSIKLYENYMNQSYISYLQRSSSSMIQNIINDTLILTEKALLPVILLISELFVLLGILILLFLINPIGSIAVILLFGLLTYIYHSQTKIRIYDWGKKRQASDGKRIKTLQESFSEFKFCKIAKKVNFFIDKYAIYNKLSVDSTKNQTAFQHFPRVWLELVAVMAVCLFMAIMILQEKNQSELLSSMALFAVASFRSLPSINRILNNVQSIKFSQSVVDVIYKELKSKKINTIKNGKGASLQKTIEIREINYKYPGRDNNSINGLNLIIPINTTIGIVGGSGSGKSTLISLLTGLLKPDFGQILIDGEDINDNLNGWQGMIGYIPQEIHLLDDSLRRNIAFGVEDNQINEERLNEVIANAHLNSVISKMPNGLDSILGESGSQLSGGQRQRIGIARALYCQPKVLILDEATSALDTVTETHILNFISELNKNIIIIIVTHRPAALKICDTVVRIENGCIVNK
jgi:ATP-binding cassette, subfamily B, bacterial PglK